MGKILLRWALLGLLLLPSGALALINTPELFNGTGTGCTLFGHVGDTSITIPSANYFVELWGPGGDNGTTSSGGGGAYSATHYTGGTPGASYTIHVEPHAGLGATFTYFVSALTQKAQSGSSSGQGGLASSSIGTVTFSGGNGQSDSFPGSGPGGGGAAGPSGAGKDGADVAGGGGSGGGGQGGGTAGSPANPGTGAGGNGGKNALGQVGGMGSSGPIPGGDGVNAGSGGGGAGFTGTPGGNGADDPDGGGGGGGGTNGANPGTGGHGGFPGGGAGFNSPQTTISNGGDGEVKVTCE